MIERYEWIFGYELVYANAQILFSNRKLYFKLCLEYFLDEFDISDNLPSQNYGIASKIIYAVLYQFICIKDIY